MRTIDAGDPINTIPVDIVDAGDTSSPPTDIIISAHLLDPQPVAGIVTPQFVGVDTLDVIDPDRGLALIVKIGGTATTVTVEVPGVQPYTAVPRDDLVISSVSNTERVFYLPDLLTEPTSEVAAVTYSQTAGVTAAVFKVNR
jgi:hypothetical protein